MRKYRYFISFIVLLFIVFLKIFMENSFNKVKDYLQKDMSLYKVGYSLINYNNEEITVSNNKSIYVLNYYLKDNIYYIENVGLEVRFNLNGYVSYINRNKIKIDVSKDISFYVILDQKDVKLYEKIYPNKIIGYSKYYQIYSDNKDNLELLKFTTNYEEI